jgi:hypothetical protein
MIKKLYTLFSSIFFLTDLDFQFYLASIRGIQPTKILKLPSNKEDK